MSGPPRICQHDGCENTAMRCCNFVEEDTWDDEWFCGEHAAQHGYCGSCGDFWGGICSFEASGYCEQCEAEIRGDEYDEDETADYWEDEI